MSGFLKIVCEIPLIRASCGLSESLEGRNGLLAVTIALLTCAIAYGGVHKNISKIDNHYKTFKILGFIFLFVGIMSYLILQQFYTDTAAGERSGQFERTGSGTGSTEDTTPPPDRTADTCTTPAPGEPALSPFTKALICYEKEGCAATKVLCRAFGASATGDLPCASRAAAALDPNVVLSVADLAETRSCTVDALAWLAGAPASVRIDARNRAINLIANTCDKGGFGADQPIAEKIATSLNIATPCKR